MNFGEILRKTRLKQNLTQEDLGAELFCEASTISKIENNIQDLKISTIIEWLVITQRLDILVLYLKGLSSDDILKHAFTEEYLNGLYKTDIPHISLEEIKARFENSDKIISHFNKNQEGN